MTVVYANSCYEIHVDVGSDCATFLVLRNPRTLSFIHDNEEILFYMFMHACYFSHYHMKGLLSSKTNVIKESYCLNVNRCNFWEIYCKLLLIIQGWQNVRFATKYYNAGNINVITCRAELFWYCWQLAYLLSSGVGQKVITMC